MLTQAWTAEHQWGSDQRPAIRVAEPCQISSCEKPDHMGNQTTEENLKGLRMIRLKKKNYIRNMILTVRYLKEENGNSRIPPTARLPFMGQGKRETSLAMLRPRTYSSAPFLSKRLSPCSKSPIVNAI